MPSNPIVRSLTTGNVSSDLDGSIVGYEGNFGDGSPTVTGPLTTSHTYTAVGTCSAQLKVTDNSGLTDIRSVARDAQSPVVQVTMRVADIAMSVNAMHARLRR